MDSYKTELISDRVWRTNAHLELQTVNYVGWFNHRRLHSSIGNRPPAEHERSRAGPKRSRLRPLQPSPIHETS